MTIASRRLARALDLRPGEGRTLGVLGGYLLVCSAASIILVATMNGLFLSVYPRRLIPQVIVASAIVTAIAAVLFSGVLVGAARRILAAGFTAALVLTLVLCRWAVGVNARTTFAVYLAVSTVQVLLLTHAWNFVGDVLKGRQAKRLVPLIGIFASVGVILGGSVVPAAALRLGTADLLLVGGGLILAALPLLWLVSQPEPHHEDAPAERRGTVRAFAARAARGLRGLQEEPLLRLLAIGMFAIGLTGTLVELAFKLALQASYQGDRITAVLGVLGSITGAGTLLMQLLASRLIFPKLGVSFAAKLHGGLETLAVGVASLVPGVWFLAGALATDDILQNSVQKGWEQVSLVPFPGRVKSAAIATLDGVMQPLSRAVGGAITILLVSRLPVVSAIMTASAAVAFVLFLRHRKLYVAALTRALTRHTIDLVSLGRTPLVVDQESLAVIDRSLADADPTVVVFAVSLLEQLPAHDATGRLVRLLDDDVDEVRAEACHVIRRMELEHDTELRRAVVDRLAREEKPFVLAALLEAMGAWSEIDTGAVEPFLDHAHPDVRRAALVTLGRTGWPPTRERIRALLASERGADRALAAKGIGALHLTELVDDAARAVDDAAARPAALEALARLGAPAVPVLVRLLEHRAVPLPVRRSVVTALASMPEPEARLALLGLVEEPALGPAALTSLERLRREGRLAPVDPEILRGRLASEVDRGFRYAAVASEIRGAHNGGAAFISREMEGLCERAISRVSRILSLSHDPAAVEAARAGLASDDVGRRGNALELLESLLAPEESRLVLPFAEALSEGFPVETIRPGPRDGAAAPLEALVRDDDWWPKALALHALGRDEEISIPGRDPDSDEEPDMIPLIERVMILKGSELFRNFPGSDLAGIAALVEVVHLDTGDVVFAQGDPGDAFFMVVRGAIRISRGSHDLALLGPREGFGEMAILDQETRSATATAATATTLLRIDRDSFDRLIEQNPSVARGIYRVLNQRLRSTLAQLAAG